MTDISDYCQLDSFYPWPALWFSLNNAHFRCGVCTKTLAFIVNFFPIFVSVLAIAEVYFQEGNKKYNEKEFSNAVYFFTEGIKMNCKDTVKNAKMYSNRAAAYSQLGSMSLFLLLLLLSFTLLCFANLTFPKWLTNFVALMCLVLLCVCEVHME